MAGIGDTLMATPLIHELRANFPDATIDALVHLARLQGFAGKQSASEPRSPEKSHQVPASWRRCASSGRCGANATTFPSTRIRRAGCIIASPRASPARPIRISHEYECFGWLDRKLVNKVLPQDYSRHSIENNFDVLPLLGAKSEIAVARDGNFPDAGRGKMGG